MNNSLAYNTYAQNNIGVESPQKLIEMLYEGILRFNMQAKRAIAIDDIEKRTYYINRSTAIFAELLNSLSYDGDGVIAEYLNGLYAHQLQILGEANLENSIAKVDQVNKVVKGLLEAWRESIQVGME